MATMSEFALKVCRILIYNNPLVSYVNCPITGERFEIKRISNDRSRVEAYGIRYETGHLHKIVISDIDSMENIAVLRPWKADEIQFLSSYACLRFAVDPIETKA